MSWSVRADFFLQDFQPNSCIHSSPSPRVQRASLLTYYLIFSPG
jgi:hypothetical protein